MTDKHDPEKKPQPHKTPTSQTQGGSAPRRPTEPPRPKKKQKGEDG